MSEWKQKRFWKQAGAAEDGDGFAVELDGRRIRTPAKVPLQVPTRALAEMVAAEWDAQGDFVDPGSMPATRMVNAAIDKVRTQHAEVADLLAEYGGTDLLCYRAESPQSLAVRQAEQWDPALDWAEQALGVRLSVGAGITHIPQPAQHLSRLSADVHVLSDFQLAAFHDLVTLSGSLILGFAAARRWRSADEIWQMSRLDELWQQEQWGEDEEAVTAAEIKRQAFLHADKFFAIC